MLFHAPHFGLFLLAVLGGAALLARHRTARHLFLLLASYVFYMAWNVRYLGLVLFSTLLDYVIGSAIHRSGDPRRRKLLLLASLAGNLGVLGLFKYYNFFLDNAAALLAAVGLHPSLPALRLLLPVGISFYTFQTLSYTLEIYRGNLEPRKSFLDFALFVTFFPQLVAGPIVRAHEFLPQLDRPPDVSDRRASSGLYLVLKGLTKKVVLADLLGVYLVDPVFRRPEVHGPLLMLLAIYAFKFQIYNDFSGYSDIAIGCGRMLGFELPVNFRSPYKAANIREYWARWHITLGSWFRDYVFFPLGGSRGGTLRTSLNILVTMMLVGLWHGASWTFVLWGAYYGALMAVESAFAAKRRALGKAPRLPRPLRVLVAFHATALAALFFRSSDLRNLKSVALTLVAGRGVAHPAHLSGLLVVLAAAAVLHFLPEEWKVAAETGFVRLPSALQAVVCVTALVAFELARGQVHPFYYFQF